MAEEDCEGILCDLIGTPKKCRGSKFLGMCLTDIVEKFFFWIPRVFGIGIAFITFILAFGVFLENWTLTEQLIGFFIQLIPFFIVLAILIIAWRWELIGGIIYIGLGIAIIIFTVITRPERLINSMILWIPLFFVGSLFILYWYLTEVEKNALVV